MTTKQKILYEALDLFAIHGYEAVSMRDIGRAVGIRESSIYKHYTGKQAIMDAIVEKATEELNAMLEQFHVPDAYQETDVSQYVSMEFQEIADLCIKMLFAQKENDFIRKFRQLLTIEQYRNEEMRKILIEMFMERQLQYIEKVFMYLLQHNIVNGASAKQMALEFYAPFFLLQYRYGMDKEKLEESLKEHVIIFLKGHVRD